MGDADLEAISAATAPPRVGLCFECDYPLRGLPDGRCPECGRPFDPDERSTMNLGRPLGRLGRWALRPVAWPVVLVALAPAGWAVWVATDPDVYYMGGSGVLCAFVGVAVLLLHAGWVTARSVVLLRRGQPDSVRADDRGRWKLAWAVTAAAAALVMLEMPVRLAFLAHRAKFERLVAEVRSNAPAAATLPGRRVGMYTLSTLRPAETNERAVMFRFGGDEEGGFAYCPDGDAELLYNPGDHGRLWGPWYWFSED